jgi:hypothetical protein
MNSVKLSLLTFLVILLSCNTNEKRHKFISLEDNVSKSSQLNESESILINEVNKNIVKIDSMITDKFGCNKNIKYYDKFHNMKIEEFKITCLSDMRQVWSNKLFFGNNLKDTLLIISLDGLGNVIEVKR